ncbi:MAG TPA: flavin reductase family protein [Acidobacteriaceae bacterium]|nr:flavin reductase family protein [Acidobacteriaceae bacterium]
MIKNQDAPASIPADESSMRTLKPGDQTPQDTYKLLVGSVVPRPIAFVSSIDAEGVRNLAPFSFFTVASANPPIVCFCPMVRPANDKGLASSKDTLRNVVATREFVLNIVSEDFATQMNACSAELPPQVDEFEISGLTPLASEVVRPPRVAESHIQMECRLAQVVHVSTEPLGGSLVLGEVLRFHIRESLLDNFRIDPDKLHAIGRMAGSTYARTTDRFELVRPK